MKNDYSYTMQILEYHLDTFGHVNNATYLSLYEQARWDIIHNKGWGIKDIMKKGCGPVVLEVQSLVFLKELKNREVITIVSKPKEWTGKVGIVEQEILNEKGEVCSKVSIVFGFFDTKERGLIYPPQDFLDALTPSENI